MRTALIVAIAVVAAVAAASAEEEGTVLTKPKLGEFWYSMLTAEGEPQGYCRLNLTESAGGGLDVDWELKISYSGGSYEEERRMVVDGDWRILTSRYVAGGVLQSEAKRAGNRLVGKWLKEGELVECDLEVRDTALTGMGFVMAAAMAREEGASREFEELHEEMGFATGGVSTLAFIGEEKVEIAGEEQTLFKYELTKGKGGKLPIWVNADREIAQVDWGGGNVMQISAESTAHLFAPAPPAVSVEPSGPEKLVVAGDFEAFTPQELYDHFTLPELLTKWWPPEATVEMKEGGAYTLDWPEMSWKMLGRVKAFEPGKRFVFSWIWAHSPEGTTPRTVEVVFTPREEGGSRLVLTHGDYGEGGAEAQAKQGHRQGWEQFLTRLRDLRK